MRQTPQTVHYIRGQQTFFKRSKGRIYAGCIISKETRNQFFITKLGEDQKNVF